MAEVTPYEQLNEDVAGWAKHQAGKMRRIVGSLVLRDKIAVYKSLRNAQKVEGYKKLERSIGSTLKKEFDQVNRINFRFQKQGIWLEHGVGKGRPVRSLKARPKPWLAPILDPAIDDLADLIASGYLDIAAGEIKFLIPGVLDRRVKIQNNG